MKLETTESPYTVQKRTRDLRLRFERGTNRALRRLVAFEDPKGKRKYDPEQQSHDRNEYIRGVRKPNPSHHSRGRSHASKTKRSGKMEKFGETRQTREDEERRTGWISRGGDRSIRDSLDDHPP